MHSLHVLVADGLFVSLNDTIQNAPYVIDVGNLCTDTGVSAQVTRVRASAPIEGGITVTDWGASDSADVVPGSAPGPGALRGRISDYPDYRKSPIRNPCSDEQRVTDLVVQVARTSAGTGAIRGVVVDYRTKRGDGRVVVATQVALCAKPNAAAACHKFVG